jgi:peptide deformylase
MAARRSALMAVRPVLRLPDPVLKTPARPVDGIDDAARALAEDLIDTMRASPACVGLAAPQIGVGLRAFAVDVTGHKKARSCHGELVLFNPEILLAHGPLTAREGCMSVPDLTGDVSRPTRLVVRGITPEAEERVFQVDAFEARAFLHEVDHLDGLLFLDRVTSSDAVFRRKVYR